MRTVRLGRTGLQVSRVGFGGIPIQRLTEAEAIRVVRRCLDLGVTFLDTANSYTTSEERIGKAIAGRRAGLVLATKTQARDRATAAAHLDLSLQRADPGRSRPRSGRNWPASGPRWTPDFAGAASTASPARRG